MILLPGIFGSCESPAPSTIPLKMNFFSCSELAPSGIGTRFFHPILLVVRRALTVTIARAANHFCLVLFSQGGYRGFISVSVIKTDRLVLKPYLVLPSNHSSLWWDMCDVCDEID